MSKRGEACTIRFDQVLSLVSVVFFSQFLSAMATYYVEDCGYSKDTADGKPRHDEVTFYVIVIDVYVKVKI